MAERRGGLQHTTTAEFNDDLILEIVKRLPLKCAVRCSVLNKNICRRIFEPNFLPSYSTIFHRHRQQGAKIFTKFSQEIRSSNSTTVHSLCNSVTLDVDVSIITSCNGLLLLRFQNPNSYYIFNPTTSAVMSVDHDVIGSSTAVGLAVPDNSGEKLYGSGFKLSNSGFKLVTAVEEVSVSSEKTRLKFRVIGPSVTDSGELTSVKSRVFDFDRSFKLMNQIGIQPVYAHGNLYLLGDGGRVTAAFDVEKEEARLIDGPVEGKGGHCLWFGFALGSIHLVYYIPMEIVIWRHDHFTSEWGVKHRVCRHDHFTGVKHRVSSILDPKRALAMTTNLALFDGRLLLFMQKPRGGGDTIFATYDVENDVWKRVGSEVDNKLQFVSYTSSLVKVSDTYLDGSIWKYGEGIRRDLLKLQELLRPTNEIFSA